MPIIFFILSVTGSGDPSTGAYGTANTGGGGGGGRGGAGGGGSGGSGIVILKYSSTLTATFSGGVTQTTTNNGLFKISTITAAGLSDTVSWS